MTMFIFSKIVNQAVTSGGKEGSPPCDTTRSGTASPVRSATTRGLNTFHEGLKTLASLSHSTVPRDQQYSQRMQQANITNLFYKMPYSITLCSRPGKLLGGEFQKKSVSNAQQKHENLNPLK